jgi:tetratricopeptide (TPR) repeat protein
MRKYSIISFISLIFILLSCTSGKQLTQVSDEGAMAMKAGDYNKALQAYQQLIADYEKKGKADECPYYGQAGKAAFALGNTDKAIEYLSIGVNRPGADAEMCNELAQCYRKIDNLSKEITTLENCLKKYPGSAYKSAEQKRLFQTYVESENWELAVKLWPEVKAAATNDIKLQEGYLVVNEKLKNDSICNILAPKLLKLDPHNVTGLEWEAKRYYWKAENLYQEEMAAYEKHKTNRQYNHLLKALDVVTTDFKKSLKYFKSLYSINPDKNYAKYLANIYARLDDKKMAEHYLELSK